MMRIRMSRNKFDAVYTSLKNNQKTIKRYYGITWVTYENTVCVTINSGLIVTGRMTDLTFL